MDSSDQWQSFVERYHRKGVYMIADGRVVWRFNDDMIRGIDILAGDTSEPIKHRTPPWDIGRWEYCWTFNELMDIRIDIDNGVVSHSFEPQPRTLCSWFVTDPPFESLGESMVYLMGWDDGRGDEIIYSPDIRIAIAVVEVDDAGNANCAVDVLYTNEVVKGDNIRFIHISPCGQLAFVSHDSHWYVWDIARGATLSTGTHTRSHLSVVLPDWTCVATVDNSTLMIVEARSGIVLREDKKEADAMNNPRETQVSPDGRRIVVVGADRVSVDSIRARERGFVLNLPELKTATITPDGKSLVCFRARTIEIYELESGRNKLSQLCLNDMNYGDRAFTALDGTIVWSDDFGDFQLQWTLRNATYGDQIGAPIVTPTRVFRYDTDPAAHQNAVNEGKPLLGRPDPHLTCICLHCGKRSIIPETAEQTLDDIRVSANKSPCLHLPDEAWDQPELLIACQHCQGPLRLNPFVVS